MKRRGTDAGCEMRESEAIKSKLDRGASALSTALEVMATPPPAAMALNEVLGAGPIDLHRLSSVGRSYAGPTAQILQLCNASIFSLSHPVASLEQAVIALGAGVVRTLGLAWGLVDLVGKHLPPAEAQPFWQHSLTTALLSERIAGWVDYPITEAYLAGFLHDIGRVPLLMAAAQTQKRLAFRKFAREATGLEMRQFGVDHCELGRQLGIAWGFPDLLVDVFGQHHELSYDAAEPELVRIVAMAERFCSRQAAVSGSAETFHLQTEHTPLADPDEQSRNCATPNAYFPHLDIAEGGSLAEALEFEFLQAAQWLRFGALTKPSGTLWG